MPKKGEYVRFKNYEREIKPPIMIYADFENILVPEDNKKQYPGESYTNKYQKHVACSYIYKLICVDDNFIKPFKSSLVEDALREKCPNTDQKNSVSGPFLHSDAVYNFVNSLIEESKYCNDVMKKHFNKKLVMTKKDNEDFENSSKCWICDVYVDGDVKVDHCHITTKYRILRIAIVMSRLN